MNNGTLDQRKGMFFVFIGDPMNEYVKARLSKDFDNIKHFDHFADYNPDSEIHLMRMDYLHNETAIYNVSVKYKVVMEGEVRYIEHSMMGDSPINKTRLTKTSINLINSERVVACSGVFSKQMYSLMFTSNYSKTSQINDFHRYYDQSFETRYDFEMGEGIAFINAGFLSKFQVNCRILG